MFGGSVCASADLLPPAGEGWHSLVEVRDGNARPLGKPLARGSIGIPSASLPAAAHAPVKNSQRQRKEKQRPCVNHPDNLRTIRHGSVTTGIAEENSVPEGQAKSEQAPIRRPPSRGGPLHRSAPSAFLFGPCTARFSFGKTKEKWGVHPRWTSPLREQTPPWPPSGGPPLFRECQTQFNSAARCAPADSPW